MFIVFQGLWKYVYITKEKFSNLVKALVGFKIEKENFIRPGISKFKNTSYQNIFLCCNFSRKIIYIASIKNLKMISR